MLCNACNKTHFQLSINLIYFNFFQWIKELKQKKKKQDIVKYYN